MLRLVMLPFVVLLGFVPLFMQGGPVAGQEGTPAAGEFRLGPNHGDWAEVARPVARTGQATRFNGQILQPYDVFFNMEYAAVPPLTNVELMIVEVQSGEFALEIPAQGRFVVDRPDGSPIAYLQTVQNEPFYVPTNTFVRDEAGNVCTRMCAVPVGTAVMLKPGDITTVFPGSVCIWCLLNSSATIADQGMLLVSAVLDDTAESPDAFSWVEDWDRSQGEPAQAAARKEGALGWAFFNPQARCRSGGG